MRSPLEQFKIKELIKLEIFDFNRIIISDILIYAIIGIGLILIIEKEGEELKMSKKLVIKELGKEIIEKIIRTIVSGKDNYLVLLKGLLSSILIYNIIGLVPYNKTITSELILTITISLVLLIGITLIGIEKNGIKILKILVPNNTPIILVPLLVIIETISYIARGLSLGLRLGANMIAGHTLLKIIITFIFTLLNLEGPTSSLNDKNIISESPLLKINKEEILKWIIIIIPIVILILIILLELGVAIMQALVFVIITGIYINDVDQDIK